MEPTSNQSIKRLGLKKLRKQSLLSQAQAAKLIGVTDKAFRSYENDGAIPSFDKAVLMAKAFNVPLRRIAEEFGLDTSGIPFDLGYSPREEIN